MDKTANGGDSYDIHGEVDRLLAGIEFEIGQLQTTAQRARQFLADVAGPGWANARVLTYQVSDGTRVHMAALSGAYTQGTAMILVAESLDGSLMMLQPTSEDPPRALNPLVFFAAQWSIAPEQAQVHSELVECVKKINRALVSIAKIVKLCATVKPRRKSYLLNQIAHANQHLIDYVDMYRPQGE